MLVTSNCLTHTPFAVIDQTDRINGRRVGGGDQFRNFQQQMAGPHLPHRRNRCWPLLHRQLRAKECVPHLGSHVCRQHSHPPNPLDCLQMNHGASWHPQDGVQYCVYRKVYPNGSSVSFFNFKKGSHFTENQWIEWHPLTLTHFYCPSTVSGEDCNCTWPI